MRKNSDRHYFSRRDFVMTAGLIGAGLATGPALRASSFNNSMDTGGRRMKTRKLGSLEVSELGAGAMR